MSRNVILAAATATAVASLIGGCSSADNEATFDPRALAAPHREAAQGLAPSEPLGLPAKLDSLADSPQTPKQRFKSEGLLNPLTTEERVVKVDLREAIQRAVVNNLDVRVASYSPAIEETRYTEADARFDPTFIVNPTIERNKTIQFAGNGALLGADYTRTSIETGFKQLLDTGGEYSLTYSLQHIDTGPAAGAIAGGLGGPVNQYYTELKLQITQPILRDFGRDTNRARIDINRNNQQIAVLDFRDKLEQTLTDLEKTYWQLVQAQREVEIQQELLTNTINTANTLYQRMNQDVTRLQISQANASIETRRAQLVRAKAHVADLGDDLKLLMSDPTLPIGGTQLVLPATPPVLQQVLLDPANQIDTALLNRQELGSQQLRIDSALIALRVSKNNEQPRLDVVGSASLQGNASQLGPSFDDAGNNFGDDYKGLLSLGLQFEYPLGNRAAKAIFRRAQLQYLQSNDSYRQIIETVVRDVMKASREVQTTWTEIVRTRQATFAAADALRSVQVREDASEPLTPEFVDLKLRQQETLAQAQRDEAAAISNYNIALSALERVKGTLLKYNNVVMEEAALPKTN